MMATMNDNGKNGRSLPDGWEWKTLDDICIIKYGKNLPTSIFTEYGYPVFGANGIIGKYDAYLYEEEQVLISCRGAYSGKINLSPPKCFITNNSLVLEFSENINKKFIYYALQIVDKTKLVTGTAQPQVTINNAKIVKIPLAPISEQERIVNRIEELLSDLDAGVAALKRVRAGLKRYKASVLKAACEGKLVEQDANDEPANVLYKKILEERRSLWETQLVKKGKAKSTKYSEPELPEIEDENLPNGWIWASLDSLTYRVTYGITVRPKYVEEGVPIISAREIRSGEIDLEISHKISNEDYEKLRHNCILYYDDVLFSKTGTIGHVARVKHDMPLSVSQNVAVLSPVVWSKYLEMVLRSPIIQRLAQSKIKTTAIPDLQLGLMKKFPIPLPPLDEQRRIVAEVERRLSVVREVESTVEMGLVRAGRLRQAVLRSAFEGRL